MPYEDQGELGQLKKMYASKLGTIKEMFPDWTDEDLVFALQETSGDLERTIDRISEGTYSALTYRLKGYLADLAPSSR